eukprot:scaffold149240_cov55-Attheya_sp.AAC.1
MIDDCPKCLHLNPTDETHSIKVPGADSEDDYLIPLRVYRVLRRSFQLGNQPCENGKIVDKSS